MFLRIADTLIELFLFDLRRLDYIDRATTLISLDKLNFFWIGKESKKIKQRTLTGPEKLILFEKDKDYRNLS